MALLDVFRKKEEKKVEKKEKKKVEKPAEIKVEKKIPNKIVKSAASVKPKKTPETAYRVLKQPHVTERASFLSGKNQYVFKILPKANKNEVKRAVEDLFGVRVVRVRIINIPKKKKRLGRIEGFKSGYKKAIVRVKEGQKIEILPR